MTHLIMMDFPRLSLLNILTHECCLPCCYWDFSKPHTYQCYQWGNVLRGSLTVQHCPVGFMTRFQQMTFFPIYFSLGQLIRLNAGSWRVSGNTCFQIAFLLHLQHFWALLSTLDWHCPPMSCRWNVVLGMSYGSWQWNS